MMDITTLNEFIKIISSKAVAFSKEKLSLTKTNKDGKIYLGNQVKAYYGQHRSGWAYVVNALNELNNPKGTYLDCFIERTFCWNPEGVHPILKPWIGFIHVPPNVPKWFQYEQSNEYVFQTKAWQDSLPYCKGLITLSNYHKKSLQPLFNFPVENFIHPTETPEIKWTWKKFISNNDKKVIQIGWYLRKLHAIYLLQTSKFKKVFLKVTNFNLDTVVEKEKQELVKTGEFKFINYDDTKIIYFMPNEIYDKMLAENIVFIQLYDSSANNTIIECIVRNTPILINPLEPVIEYLGKDYPFYYNSYEEANQKLEDFDLIKKTHEYLRDMPDKNRFSREYFVDSFIRSKLYESL